MYCSSPQLLFTKLRSLNRVMLTTKHTTRVRSLISEEIASAYRGEIYVYKVDVDQCETLADAYDIRSIPTTMFVPMKGRPVKMVGAINKRELERHIKDVLLKNQLHHAEV